MQQPPHSPNGLQLPVTLNWPKEQVATGVPLQPGSQLVLQVVLCVAGSEQFQPSALDTLAGRLWQPAARGQQQQQPRKRVGVIRQT